jgi:hypothetical protein
MPSVSNLILFLLGLSSLTAFGADREVLFPGQMIRIGETTVECRAGGGGGGDVPVCSTEGLARAKEICNEMPTWAQIDQCLLGLRKSYFMNLRAVNVCREMPTWNQIQGCLAQIADKDLSDADVPGIRSKPASRKCRTSSTPTPS